VDLVGLNNTCIDVKHVWCAWSARVVRTVSTYGADA